MLFDQELDPELAKRILRIQLWEAGHDFKDIDTYSIQDVSDIVGFWSGKNMGQEKLSGRSRRLSQKG